MRFHTGYISFGTVPFANVIFAWHNSEVVDILKLDNVMDHRCRGRS